MEQRPKAVSVTAGFLFAATPVAAIVGTSLLFPGKLLDWLSQFNKPAMAAFQMLGRISGILLLALAVGAASAATGLIRRRTWAWWFTVILFSVNGCGDLLSFYLTGVAIKSISGIAICSCFLYALSRQRIRLYFRRPLDTD